MANIDTSEIHAFFSNTEVSLTKCKLLAKDLDKSVSWESHKASPFSQEVVKNKEILARQIYSPIHVEMDTNDLKPTAFEDVFNKGLAINRLSYISPDQLHVNGANKASVDNIRIANPSKVRNYLGYVEATSSDVRSILESGLRVFAVYDTALEHDISHADICCILAPSGDTLPKKVLYKKLRFELKEVFGKLLTN